MLAGKLTHPARGLVGCHRLRHAVPGAAMARLLDAANQGVFAPDRGAGDQAACRQAVKNGGFYGPFVGLG